jgi:hypothetical protein
VGKIKDLLIDNETDDFYVTDDGYAQEELFYETTINNVVSLMLTYGRDSIGYRIKQKYDAAREAMEESSCLY